MDVACPPLRSVSRLPHCRHIYVDIVISVSSFIITIIIIIVIIIIIIIIMLISDLRVWPRRRSPEVEYRALNDSGEAWEAAIYICIYIYIYTISYIYIYTYVYRRPTDDAQIQ